MYPRGGMVRAVPPSPEVPVPPRVRARSNSARRGRNSAHAARAFPGRYCCHCCNCGCDCAHGVTGCGTRVHACARVDALGLPAGARWRAPRVVARRLAPTHTSRRPLFTSSQPVCLL
ncbi:hypothetical protein EON67_11930 [archaeon]|nr:MAG: hypothetical protein EON67_11930 [archaeon]